MQPEFIQIESELTELWWRVPLALSAVIGCLWLFGLAIGSISSSSSRDPKSTAQSEAYGILRTIWCHIAHRKFHRDTGVKFADCCKTQCTRCDVVFLGAIKTISKFSAKDHPNKKHL